MTASIPSSEVHDRRLVDLAHVLDDAPLTPAHVGIAVLAFAMLTIEGADIQLLGFLAPLIRTEWGTTPIGLSVVLSAGLIGSMIGAILFGTVGDRIGRRPVCIMTTVIFGLGTAASGIAWDVPSLIVIRFIAGLGLGGIIPNALAVVTELSPAARRATIVALVAIGLQAGGMIGAALTRIILPSAGWRGAFLWMGGLSLLAVPAMVAFLPESPRFLILRGGTQVRLRKIIARFVPTSADGAAPQYILGGQSGDRGRLRQLFSEGRARSTLLLWGLFAGTLFGTAFMVNWLPTLLNDIGLTLGNAIMATSALNAGGVVGGLMMAPLIQRYGAFPTLSATFVLAAVAVAAIPYFAVSVTMAMIMAALAGMAVIGPVTGMNVAASQFYPTAIRGTGVGWALAVGRTGSILGPVSAGVGFQAGLKPADIFIICSVVSALTAVIALSLSRMRPSR